LSTLVRLPTENIVYESKWRGIAVQVNNLSKNSRQSRTVVTLVLIALAMIFSGCGSSSSPIIYPRDALPSVDPFASFQWTPVAGARSYSLKVGTRPNAADVYFESNLQQAVRQRTVWGLSPDRKYYAAFYVQTQRGWDEYPFSFQTTAPSKQGPATPADLYQTVESLTASVRLSTEGLSTLPTPDSKLAEEVAALGKSTADCANFADVLVALLSENGIYSRRVSLVLADWINHVVVEYWDPFLSEWAVADPTFGAVYFDDAAQRGQSAEELSSDVVSESFNNIHPKFVTSNGSLYMKAYFMDPVTMFLNVVPQGMYIPDAAINPAYQYLIASNSGHSGCFQFRAPSGSGVLVLNDPPDGHWQSGTITLQPWDSSGWIPTICLNDAWSIEQQPPETKLYTFRRILF
jgi:hypothetical protein